MEEWTDNLFVDEGTSYRALSFKQFDPVFKTLTLNVFGYWDNSLNNAAMKIVSYQHPVKYEYWLISNPSTGGQELENVINILHKVYD